MAKILWTTAWSFSTIDGLTTNLITNNVSLDDLNGVGPPSGWFLTPLPWFLVLVSICYSSFLLSPDLGLCRVREMYTMRSLISRGDSRVFILKPETRWTTHSALFLLKIVCPTSVEQCKTNNKVNALRQRWVFLKKNRSKNMCTYVEKN